MGSYNWGDNGWGACDPGMGVSGLSEDGLTGPGTGCAQALSGWVSVKPWTIYEATCTCEDLIDGPYPMSSLYGSSDPSYIISGQALRYKTIGQGDSTLNYDPSDLGTTVKPGGAGYSYGVAWQGSDIDSDAASEQTLDFGDWSGGKATQYGTAHMAFGNPEFWSSKSAQYAMACFTANYWVNPSLTRVPSPLARQSQLTDPVTGYRQSSELTYNPNPAERNHVIEHADGKHIKLHRRITLQEGEKRKVVMDYPKGFERGPNRITFAAEYVTPDMSAPTQEHFDLTKIHQKARYKKNKAIFTVKSRKLALTTMLNAQLNLVKSD